MSRQDFDEMVRLRAYETWVREGRPNGREHEHWAEAAREIDESEEDEPLIVTQPWQTGGSGRNEAERLRRALWEPQPYCL